MLGLYGLVKRDLELKGILPDKFKEPSKIPPVIQDSCFLYVDAINNTGNGHNNNATSWKNLMETPDIPEMQLGTKYGSPTWKDNACVLPGSSGWYFGKNRIEGELTMEFCGKFSATNYYNTAATLVSCYDYSITKPYGACLRADWDSNSNLGFFSSVYYTPDMVNVTTGMKPKVDQKFYFVASCKRGKYFIRLYRSDVEGYVEKSGATCEPNFLAGAPWSIGYHPTSSDSPLASERFFFQGDVYSARVHTRALTGDEIHQNALHEMSRYEF